MRGRRRTRSRRLGLRHLLSFRAPFAFRLATLALCTLGMAACQGCRSSSTPAAAAPAAPDLGPPTLHLYLVTDLAGALEPCGSTKDQLGGVDHFGAWVRQSASGAPSGLVASAGPLFFMDPALDAERADQDRAKAGTIARVLHGLGLAAFAPGVNDWADGSAGLASLAGAAEAPAIVPARPPGLPSPPFVSVAVRDVGALKVGFVGYGQPAAPAQGPSAEDAVKQGVEEAKRQGANVLVALAAVGRGEAKRIADAVPELTAVVVGSAKSSGDANTTSPQGERVGDVLIAQAANHLQSVAVLDLYVREPIAPGHVVKFADATGLELAQQREDIARRIDELHDKISAWEREKSVSAADLQARRHDLAKLEAQRDQLDAKSPPAEGSFFRYAVKEMRESLGKDPAIDADMASYYKAVNDHNRTAFADRVPVPAAADQASYVGIDVCSSCHPGARQVWNATSHARAYATLSSEFKEFNLECVGCHVTGYDRPGGSTVTHVTGLTNVQCEVCHGPGSKHAAKPNDPTLITGAPAASSCLQCHHPPHVEGFDAAARMKDILGPGHGLPMQ
jgi:2',3'-cyclic-nucleotide 2'-phosphodiesterase (5'-nucleotidase family)